MHNTNYSNATGSTKMLNYASLVSCSLAAHLLNFFSRKQQMEGVKCCIFVSFFVISHPFTPGERYTCAHTNAHTHQCTKNI